MSHTPSSYICHLNTGKKSLVYGFSGYLCPLVYISEHECDSEKASEYFSLSEHFSHP